MLCYQPSKKGNMFVSTLKRDAVYQKVEVQIDWLLQRVLLPWYLLWQLQQVAFSDIGLRAFPSYFVPDILLTGNGHFVALRCCRQP